MVKFVKGFEMRLLNIGEGDPVITNTGKEEGVQVRFWDGLCSDRCHLMSGRQKIDTAGIQIYEGTSLKCVCQKTGGWIVIHFWC